MDWLLPIIADHVFSYLVDEGKVGIYLRQKLTRDPVKEAFIRALRTAVQYLEQHYPEWVAALFDTNFFTQQGAPLLARLLLRDGPPPPSELAQCWADAVNLSSSPRRDALVYELEAVAADFLEILSKALRTEPDLREIQDSQTFERMAGRVTVISQDLHAIRSQLEAKQATPETYQTYLRWLAHRCRYLDQRGTYHLRHHVQVPLEEVYISLRAYTHEMPEKYAPYSFSSDGTMKEDNALWMMYDDDEENFEDDAISLSEMTLDKVGPQKTTEELSTVINSYDHLMILGDPGSGKTTLLQYLALKHAQALLNGQQIVANGNIGTARFPILIRIADYAEHGLPKGLSLSAFLADYCIRYECPDPGLADLLQSELQQGHCLILLDGLDEIVHIDERIAVVQHIEDFVRSHDQVPNRFVFTSRIVGYEPFRLGGPFAHYIIQDMDEQQIHHFLELLCPVIEYAFKPDQPTQVNEAVVRREIESIMHAVNTLPGVRRLATNPLLLRMLALLHRTHAQFPRQRVELYHWAVDTLAYTWRTAQGVPSSALIDEAYLTRLLGRLAYWLHTTKPTGIATEQEVYTELGQEWALIKKLDWDEDHPDIHSAIKTFLQTVREHTSLLVERASGQYSFLHLTFEEYYAARYLVARRQTRVTLIRKHLHDARWEEPILLALGWVGLKSPADITSLVRTAILAQGQEAEMLGLQPSAHEDILGRDYLFALRCMNDQLPMSSELMGQLLERLAQELMYETGSASLRLYNNMLKGRFRQLRECQSAANLLLKYLMKGTSDQDMFARARAVRLLGELGIVSESVLTIIVLSLNDGYYPVLRAAIHSIGCLAQSFPAPITALLPLLSDEDTHVRCEMAWSLGKLGWPTQESERLSVLHALLEALDDEEALVRRQAAKSLALLGEPSKVIIEALVEALGDEIPYVRLAVTESLYDLRGAYDLTSQLLEALDHEDPYVRYGAVLLLGWLGQPSSEILTALLQTSHDPDPDVRIHACLSLSLLVPNSREAIQVLRQALIDEDWSVRQGAIYSLNHFKNMTAHLLPDILKLFNDDHPHIRSLVTEKIVSLVPPTAEVIQALLQVLHDPRPEVRFSAARSIGKIAHQAPSLLLMRVLLQTLHDSSSEVRSLATRSLSTFAHIPTLLKEELLLMLQESKPLVRIAAVESLEYIGYSSPEGLMIVFKALQEEEDQVRRNAAKILGEISCGEDDIILGLWEGLLDTDMVVRQSCTQALIRIGRRIPSKQEMIEQRLIQAMSDPAFKDKDFFGRKASENAFVGLWCLVTGGELAEQEEDDND